MKFYGLTTCDTCRKAQKELRAAGRNFDVIDVRADGVSVQKLQDWASKIDWKTLLNTRSTTWRKLSPEDKDGVDEKKAVSLMATHPTLIKRPIIEKGEQIYVGWTSATKDAVL
ncbi:MAG TPA: Spx/MgsR family RNA polymerase-binding regulatory protein [Hellea balneolensis]|uniref:Spx/MgsR family RNA polymerase-binding regulatory protein n=1 Tax=Hellea balneolensis TaxID=287478 RepID=A0A7C3CBW0_9PROT|nr:Spx/MgsR family RNA polymerase-binding regulatory protein [Hellea balneolensis]